LRIAREPFDAELVAESARELVERYGADTEPGGPPRSVDVFLVARDDDGAVLGCGALRALDPATVELKRMYVRAVARGRGIGRALLAALEREAAALGAGRVLLETGPLQPEAIALYESAGYRAIPCFGPYAGEPTSRYFGRSL
jgi:GNAT superfamily N-acetyltransferase